MRSLEAYLKTKDPVNPWHHAAKEGRDYMTPEDVTAAIKAGGEALVVAEAVLQAVDLGCVEDSSCTAFAALRAFRKKRKR